MCDCKCIPLDKGELMLIITSMRFELANIKINFEYCVQGLKIEREARIEVLNEAIEKLSEYV